MYTFAVEDRVGMFYHVERNAGHGGVVVNIVHGALKEAGPETEKRKQRTWQRLNKTK